MIISDDAIIDISSHREESKNSLPIVIGNWFRDASALVQSPVMCRFTRSTVDLLCITTGIAIDIALLPVTVPIHVTKGGCSVVYSGVGAVLHHSGNAIHMVGGLAMDILKEDDDTNEDGIISDIVYVGKENTYRCERDFHSLTEPLSNSNEIVEEEEGVEDELYLSEEPLFNNNDTIQEEEEGDNDFHSSSGGSISNEEEYAESKPVEPHSCEEHFLFRLRMCDFDAILEKQGHKIIRLHQSHEDLEKILDALSIRALDMAVNPKHTSRGGNDIKKSEWNIRWKPENNTAKLEAFLEKRKNLGTTKSNATTEWLSTFSSEVMTWSGFFSDNASETSYGGDVPLFKGRGIIPMSPTCLLELLLDSSRVKEYNQWSTRKNDLFRIHSESRQIIVTKIVQSETKVPIVNISTTMKLLVHSRKIDGGYIIVSRSVTMQDSIGKNCGTEEKKEEKLDSLSDSEVLWGVSVLLHVEGHPQKTELISLNQVKAKKVPKFFIKKIGVGGVVKFFESLREVSSGH